RCDFPPDISAWATAAARTPPTSTSSSSPPTRRWPAGTLPWAPSSTTCTSWPPSAERRPRGQDEKTRRAPAGKHPWRDRAQPLLGLSVGILVLLPFPLLVLLALVLLLLSGRRLSPIRIHRRPIGHASGRLGLVGSRSVLRRWRPRLVGPAP